MIPFVLDHTALLTLGAGHRQLSALVVAAAEGKAVGHVPALSLAAAEGDRTGLGEHVASLPGLEVEPVDLTAALAAGVLIGAGVDWRVTQAVHLSRPCAEWPGGRVVVSLQPALYKDTGVDPIDPTAIA
ncbi:hypothetical protein ABCR94_33520 [Streptomyces sp. 21So2-11]|uniref:hypothetical protein n=1 Tax=Streptomyces sp. 21So2-11 TaxID=3144408 RepID=UPI00321BCA9C